MKVILREDIDGLGKSGELVTVKDGFGRNFLLPRKKAVLASEQNLRQLAQSLQRYPGTEVLIVGHTDNVGTDSYNMTLSQRRADGAKSYLVSMGIPADRIRTSGRGEMEPIASNESEAGRQQIVPVGQISPQHRLVRDGQIERVRERVLFFLIGEPLSLDEAPPGEQIAVHDASVVTSRARASALPPALVISFAVARARSASTSPRTTEAPAAAILRAVSAPMPRAAPESKATFPSRRFMPAFLR